MSDLYLIIEGVYCLSELLLGSAVYCSIVSLFAVALEAFPTADSNASGYPVPL